ncbi:MAG: TatD family hydrolase [Lentisphaeria bacterium]|nr:TatD family hydrolase [Lentisphaeria bacterium]
MNGMPSNCPFPVDAHAHGAPCEDDGVFRLWNVGDPSVIVPENCFFSAGIHPWDAGKYDLAAFASLFDSPRCLAVGECGLDRTSEIPLPLQTKVFEAQIAESVRRGKPLLIHCVRCYPELLRLKSKLPPDAPEWVVHGFRGTKRKAFDLLDAGCVLSFGAGLLRDAGNMDYFAEIPLDRILVETDESPELFGQIVSEAAAMRLLPPSEFAAAVRANFRRIFRHDPVRT